MRIWSIHPQYLDTKGIVAVWRETLLAKHVLLGLTKGYTQHPQLIRFKNSESPLANIDFYLSIIFAEAQKRNYNFDNSKFENVSNPCLMTVTQGQIDYEFQHLLSKLKVRDPKKFNELCKIRKAQPHPLFRIVKGNVEGWEKI